MTASVKDGVDVSELLNGVGIYLAYKPNNAACSEGQILSWDNSNSRWICSNLADGSKLPLTGGTLSGALTLPTNGLAVGTDQMVVSGGNVGVGTSNPTAKLDVDGAIHTTSSIKIGSSSTCDGTTLGSIRWTGTVFEGCTSSGWRALIMSDGGSSGCPAGYIPIPYNNAVGTTSDFCVAKYEMKNLSGIATSQIAGIPWVSITHADAVSECSNLGTGYHLINNAEWMTIARNIEITVGNWSGGVLNTGHSDNDPSNTLVASTDDDGCFGTGQTCSDVVWDKQRRTHALSNGEVIWDFAGNAWEWVNWYIPTDRAASGNAAYLENNLQTATASMLDDSFKSLDTSLRSIHGIGTYWPGTNGDSGGRAVRGGHYYDYGEATVGVYGLNLGYSSSSTRVYGGFRCAYSPQNP